MRLVQFLKSFHLGGTEGQLVELLRGLSGSHELHVGLLDARGPLLEEVWRLGFIPEEFPLSGSVAHPGTAVQIGRMAGWLRRIGADLVHVHDFYSTLVAVPAARLAGVKVVVGRLDLAHWHGKARRAVLAELTRRADHVIANAEAVRRMLVAEERVAPSRVSVIHNGLDLPRFDARARGGLQAPVPDCQGEPVALLVANMNHPVKRQEDFLEALAQVRRDGLRVRGWLVGDGPRRKPLEALARAMGVEPFVDFLGHRTDVAALQKRAALGVLCSSAEGLSNAIIEGMAAGRPMVVTRVGGNSELVADGERGLVVPPEQPTRLAEAISNLLARPQERERMGRAARAFVEESLTLNRLVERHEALYRKVHGEAAAAFPLAQLLAAPSAA